jgi:nucleoside-diphosphate-sugar epimerase
MSYLVTGGTGFLGSYVVRDLIQKGEDVVAYDYKISNVMSNILTDEEIDKVKIVKGDVTDFIRLNQTIKNYNVNKIIHLASMLHPISNELPAKAVEVNIEGQVSVLEAAKLWDIDKVVWASSVVVFGERDSHNEKFLSNDADHHPTSMYAATKSFNEFLTKHYTERWNLNTLGLRFTVIYGPGRVRGASSFVNSLVIDPALGKSAVVDNGDDIVDWQYVEDVSRLIIKCSKIDKTKTKIFNTQFDLRSVKEAGDYVENLTGVDISYKPGTFGVAWELDDSKLQEEIGFSPDYSMEKGIKKMMNFVRKENGLDKLE